MFFSTVTIKITEEIDYHKYKIKKNIVESYDYRTLNIEPECLQTINKISSKDKCDFSDLLSVMFLNSNLNLTKVNYTRERYSIRNKTKSTEQPIYKGFLVLFCCSAYQKRTSFIVISPIFLQLPLVCWGTNARICSGLLLRFRVPVCQLSTLEKSLN